MQSFALLLNVNCWCLKAESEYKFGSELWLSGEVKEPTRLSKRVGHEVLGGLAFVVILRVGVGNARRYKLP